MVKLKLLVMSSVIALCLGLAAIASSNAHLVTVTTFTPPDLPEGIAIDKRGNVYVGMLLTGEVRKLAFDGTLLGSVFIPGFEEGDFLIGLAVDAPGNVYAIVASPFDPARAIDFNSVWRITPAGEAALLEALPDSGFPNDLAFDNRGNLYVTDTTLGKVWKIDRQGNVSTWVEHPLLAGDPDSPVGFPVGANGLAFDPSNRNLYVAVSDFGRIVRIPVGPDGSAGTPEVHLEDAALVGADGIAFDNRGNLYAAVNRQDTVVRVTPEKDIHTLASRTDGLDFPATMAFGTGRSERTSLFITNFAFERFIAGDPADPPQPGLVKIDVGVPGQPLP